MTHTHSYIHYIKYHDLTQEIDPRHINGKSNIHDDASHIEGEHIGIFHQREAALSEVSTQLRRNILIVGIFSLQCRSELLELRSTTFLSLTLVSIAPYKRTLPEVTLLGYLGEDLTLLFKRIQFPPLFPFEEEEMNITVVVSQRTLTRMSNKS